MDQTGRGRRLRLTPSPSNKLTRTRARQPYFGTLIFALCAVVMQAAAGLTIEIDYTFDSNDLFDDPAVRTALEAAAAFYEDRIQDTLLGVDSDADVGGENKFRASFTNPNTGSGVVFENFDLAADTILVVAGVRDLGGNILGRAGPGGFAVEGDQAFLDTSIARGQGNSGIVDDVDGAAAHDIALWGGALAFDLDRMWHFDLVTLPTGGEAGFLSVVLHELGHLLGLGTADSWNNLVTASTFTGAAAAADQGGPVLLDDCPEPPASSNCAHWADGTDSSVAAGPEGYITNAGAAQDAALDPTIRIGKRKLVTKLDLAGLSDIGLGIATPGVVAAPVAPQPESNRSNASTSVAGSLQIRARHT